MHVLTQSEVRTTRIHDILTKVSTGVMLTPHFSLFLASGYVMQKLQKVVSTKEFSGLHQPNTE